MKNSCYLLLLLTAPCFAQQAYIAGNEVKNLPIKKIMNYKVPVNSLQQLEATVTILDFFGTWCAPCIKALPKLETLKNKFAADLNIVLVSIEKESTLQSFISKRQPFPFSIIVDGDNLFTDAFMPPSYPYTIILDKNRKILAILNAADITEDMLIKFIKISSNSSAIKPAESSLIPITQTAKKMTDLSSSKNALVKLSQNFIYAAKTNEDAATYMQQLRELPYDSLLKTIATDDEKKAFWINLYNAFTYTSLHKNPEQYNNRRKFFGNKNIIIAGKAFSLDKIEHGILRRSKIKWSLGYLNKIFPGKTEKELRVDTLDYRLHFALNCGAKSCPPIAFYIPETIHLQLETATMAYLSGEAEYDSTTNVLKLPAILSWFRRDFGGKKKIVELLKTKQLLPSTVEPIIQFKQYDWTLYPDNFKN